MPAVTEASPVDSLRARFLSQLPVTRRMRRDACGTVRINLAEAHYYLYAGAPGPECRRLAGKLGWRPVPKYTASMPTPSGDMDVRAYTRSDDRRMLLLATPGTGEGLAVMAVFERQPVWVGAAGEAPGREPAGIPRLASARRLLHLAGDAYDAAWYSSPAKPAAVMAAARSMLGARGWSVAEPSPGMLSASREGNPELSIIVRGVETGTDFLILASRRGN